MHFNNVQQVKNKKSERQEAKPVLGPLIWTVDPLEKDKKIIKVIANTIRKWRFLFKNVQTMSLIYPMDFGWVDTARVESKKMVTEVAKKRLKKTLASSDHKFAEQTFQFSKSLSRMKATDIMIEEARIKGAGAIILGSQAQKNQPTGLGSFSEILVGKSPVPIFIVGKKVIPTKTHRILFPTDFSNASEKAFGEILKIAKAADTTVILYYQVDISGVPLYGSAVPGGIPEWIAEVWATERIEAEIKSRKWIEKAVKMGVVCEVYVENEIGAFADNVCKLSKKANVGLIAFGVRRNVWQQLFFGGSLRSVFAESEVPVMVFHSEPLS